MTKTINDISFSDLLPSSISGDEKIQAAAAALDQEVKVLSGIIDTLFIYSRIDELSEPVLKHIAWQWHVDFWDDALPISDKRTLVKSAYAWHRIKGTPGAVEAVIQDVLGGGYVEEWFEYGGEPYHFRVVSNTPPEDTQTSANLLVAIDKAKNERSQLDTIIKPSSMTGDFYLGGAVSIGIIMNLSEES